MPDAFAAGNSAAAPSPAGGGGLAPHPRSRTAPARTCRRARTAAELSLGEDEPGQGAARHFLAEEQQRATRPILRGRGTPPTTARGVRKVSTSAAPHLRRVTLAAMKHEAPYPSLHINLPGPYTVVLQANPLTHLSRTRPSSFGGSAMRGI